MDILSKKNVGKLLLHLSVFNGVIVSLLKFSGIKSNISPINIIILLFFPVLFFYFFTHLKYKGTRVLIQVILVFIIFKVLFIVFTMAPSLTDIIIYSLYSVFFLAIYFFITLPSATAVKVLNYFTKLFFVFGFIYLLQYLFHEILPSAFTEIPNLFVEVGVERYTRELEDVVIYRPNGLIGNPINFGFFLNILFSVELLFWNSKRSKYAFLKLGVIAFMIVMLFSRANILLLMGLILANIIYRRGVGRGIIIIIFLLIFVSFVVYLLYDSNPWLTFLVDRFLGVDAYAASSSAEHLDDYANAISTFIENPFIGISPDQELKSNIISDGALFIFLLHFGGIGFLLLSIAYLQLIKSLKSLFRINRDFAPQLSFFLLLVPYSILNSAILNKGLLIITAIYIGLIMNLYYKRHYEVS
jgi:hypothetical protein